MTGVLFLRLRPAGCGTHEREVVHLADPGPDGQPVVEEDGVPLRCGGWWKLFAVEVSTENPEGTPAPGLDHYGRVVVMRLCPQCVKRSATPIPPPPPKPPRAGL